MTLRHMILRSMRMRRGRTLIAVGALTLASACITTMLALYGDLERKLDKEFRSYGANIVVAAKSGHDLPTNAEDIVRQQLGGNAQILATAVAVASAKANDGTDTSVVVVGTDMHQLLRLNRWWKVNGEAGEMVLGKRAARSLSPAYPLRFSGKELPLSTGVTIESGSADDDRVFVDQKVFESWTGIRPNVLQVSYAGSSGAVGAGIARLQNAFSKDPVDVRPVRQIVEAEGRVIRKTRWMMVACGLLISITVALCVTSTLTSAVLERRRDFALMKALGASQKVIRGLFASEAALLGVLGAMFGFCIGTGCAFLIGELNFHASIRPAWTVLPTVLLLGTVIGLLSSLLPLSRLQRVEPAIILKGE